LRYLHVLLIAPWLVRVAPAVGVPVTKPVDLRVPNPVSFVVQKLLIHGARKAEKKAQDILYIHDTLELFGASLDHLRTLWLQEVRPEMPRRWGTRAATVARRLFLGRVTDKIRDAARIPEDRELLPAQIQAAGRYGFVELFGRK